MKRTIVNNEIRNVAKFLARLVRRNDKRQVELISALNALAKGGKRLKIFDPWLDSSTELVRFVAYAVRTYQTRTFVLQACNLCVGKKGGRSQTAKLAETLSQRRDLIECLIW